MNLKCSNQFKFLVQLTIELIKKDDASTESTLLTLQFLAWQIVYNSHTKRMGNAKALNRSFYRLGFINFFI